MASSVARSVSRLVGSAAGAEVEEVVLTVLTVPIVLIDALLRLVRKEEKRLVVLGRLWS